MVQAGTLNLSLGGADRDVTFSPETRIARGSNEVLELEVSNSGTIAGALEIEVTEVRSQDRRGKEPVELEQDLELEGRIAEDGLLVFGRQPVANLRETSISHDLIRIPGGGSRTFELEWWLPADTSNKAKGDSVEVYLAFSLVQIGDA